MKITALALLRWNGEVGEATLLGMAADVSNFGYFQRSSVKEMATFVARTVAKRTAPGTRQSVEHEGYICHCHNRSGLCGIAVVDNAYPLRSAFCVINKVLDDYMAYAGDTWKAVTEDSAAQVPVLQDAIVKYQDPSQADKLMKIQQELDETKIILHKTIDSVLARGEKLDTLVSKSTDLSMASQMFYKTAKKHNTCCLIQ
eukprot:jgi/Chlat1/5052/Chrsp33S05058